MGWPLEFIQFTSLMLLLRNLEGWRMINLFQVTQLDICLLCSGFAVAQKRRLQEVREKNFMVKVRTQDTAEPQNRTTESRA